jgi:hypothetical protein
MRASHRPRSLRSLVAAAVVACGLGAAAPASALPTPTAGDWSFALFSDNWAATEIGNWGDSAAGAELDFENFSTFDVYVGSYCICNYAQQTLTFTVTFYSGTFYTGSVVETDTYTLGNGACEMSNTVSVWKPGSIVVTS